MKSERITGTIQNNIYQQSRQTSSSFSHKTKVIMSRHESNFNKSIAITLHFGVLSIIQKPISLLAVQTNELNSI